MQTYASMPAFFMTSMKRKIPNPKLLCTTKITILSAEQGKEVQESLADSKTL